VPAALTFKGGRCGSDGFTHGSVIGLFVCVYSGVFKCLLSALNIAWVIEEVDHDLPESLTFSSTERRWGQVRHVETESFGTDEGFSDLLGYLIWVQGGVYPTVR